MCKIRTFCAGPTFCAKPRAAFNAFLAQHRQTGYYDLPPDEYRFGRRQNPQITLARPRARREQLFRDAVIVSADKDGYASVAAVMALVGAMQPSAPEDPRHYLKADALADYVFSRSGRVRSRTYDPSLLPIHFRARYERTLQALYGPPPAAARTPPP